VKDVLKDLVLSLPRGQRRGYLRTLLYFLPVAVIVLYTHRVVYTGTAIPTGTAHPEQSINVALNAAYCGKPKLWSARYSPQVFLTTHRELMATPFRNVIAAMSGSLDEYCRTVNDQVVVSENSLMWLARLALWYDVHLSANHLGDFLAATRMFMLLVFGFALLRTGSSVLFTLSAVVIGAEILRGLGVRDSIYPYVMTLPLLHAGLYGMAMAGKTVRRAHVLLWAFTLMMGIITAFSGSMRTVNLPLSVLMFATFVVVMFLLRDRAERPSHTAVRLGGSVAAYAVGFAIYTSIFITPLRISDDPNVSNYVYHTFAHQLVMGLAVPETDFAKREGLEWRDETSLKFARQMEPDVIYLGPTYERALLKFYRKLWREHPREMVSLYVTKLRSTGDEVFLSAAGVATKYHVPKVIGETLHRITNGFVIVPCVVGAFLLSLWRTVRVDSARWLITSLVSLAAIASLAEGFVTYSMFVGIYYSSLLYFVFYAALVALQGAVDAGPTRNPS